MQDPKPPKIQLGPLSGKGKTYHYDKVDFDEPARITNSSMKETLSQVHEWRGASARPGALDFLNLKSRGVRC